MSRQKWVMQPDDFRVLVAYAKAGGSLYAASKALGVCSNTIKVACKDAGLGSWLADNFPNRQGQNGGPGKGRELKSKLDGEIRKISSISVPVRIPETTQTKWLTRSWSKAA